MKTRTTLFALLALATILVAACAPTALPPTGGSSTSEAGGTYEPSTALDASSFSSEAELKAFLRSTEGSSTSYAYGGVAYARAESAMDSAAPAPSKSSPAVAGGADGFTNDHSGTNNQVAGVDEADIIKNDGTFIYTVSGQTLFIVRAYPGADAAVSSKTELPGQPTGLFLEGDRVAVYGSFWDTDYFTKHGLRPRNGMTYLNIYDVHDRAKPALLEEYKFDGNALDARFTDGYLYLIVTSTPDVRYPTPILLRGDDVSSVPVSSVLRFPIPYSDVQYASVHSVRLAGGDVASTTLAVEGASTLYMSPDNLYLAYTEYINEWELRQDLLQDLLADRLEPSDVDLIAKIRAVDDDVLSPAEKKARIAQVYNEYVNYLPADEQQKLNEKLDAKLKDKLDSYEAMEYTVLTKLTAKDGEVSVVASASIPGHLNDQFSLDEYQGTLRAATTISPRWNWWIRPLAEPAVMATDAPTAASGSDEKMAPIVPEESPRETRGENRVYALDGNLKVLDALKDIAPGEQIYSSRFVGDRLYLVTFRQVDPFFVFDLSDPKDLKQLGKLKIPGFSRYLHPYDEHTLIGIGRDATALGSQQGLKISLFDVRDPSKPRELAKWVADEQYSQSTAEYEHHAFLFDKDKELLVIPAYSFDYTKGSGKELYNGAMVFHITADEIELRGIVDHSDGGQQYWGPRVERSLWIEDLLYTKSPNLLRINAIDDLHSVKNVTLDAGSGSSPYPIY